MAIMPLYLRQEVRAPLIGVIYQYITANADVDAAQCFRCRSALQSVTV